MKRVTYDWNNVEEEVEFKIYESYKDFYERVGSIGIDDFIYIVSPTDVEFMDGLKENFKNIKDVNDTFKKGGHIDENLNLFEGEFPWMPVGYTTNGDYILVRDGEVMILGGYFDEIEIYDCYLMGFIEKYLRDELKYGVFPDDLIGIKHEVELISKETHYLGE